MLNNINIRDTTDCWQQYLFDSTSLKEGEDQKEITIEPAQALDEVEPLPEDCYTRPISLPEGKTFVQKSLSINNNLCFFNYIYLYTNKVLIIN